MAFQDILYVLQWWLVFFVIGLIFLPWTARIFSNFFDKGYVFSKILGIALISYTVFLVGILKLAPFTELTILLTFVGFLVINVILIKLLRHSGKRVERAHPESLRTLHVKGDSGKIGMTISNWRIFLLEEFLFLAALFFWSYIRSFEPSIHGLEKYMDFGFVNSILRSEHFPPVDIWFSPYPINYYYFGHLTTAVLTKISTIPSYITYNLMLSTLFAFTFTAGFSIGANLINQLKTQFGKAESKLKTTSQNLKLLLIGGLLSAFLISLAGNLHTIYAFFKPYENENPVPFWQLVFSPNTFPNGYWYPNATRFIPNTIHEFPIYSSVVSDLHGHYLDVPFVLLTIAVLISIISNIKTRNSKQIQNSNVQNSKRFGNLDFGYLRLFRISDFGFRIFLLAFLLAIMYMTNAWDGIIYLLLTTLIIIYIQAKSIDNAYHKQSIKYYVLSILRIKPYILHTIYYILFLVIGFFLFSLPFNLHFKPFASGIGVLCAPEFLTNIGRLGPFLFEADHCQKSPWWQLIILYGFFYFWAISFIVFLLKRINPKYLPHPNLLLRGERKRERVKSFKNLNFIENLKLKIENLPAPDIFILLLILFSTFLILLPEFIYAKDIYPGHYRANTMFKLGYQAFIMLSIASGYIIIRLVSSIKYYVLSIEKKILYIAYVILATLYLILVFLYPYFAINSYYGELKTYHGLDGLQYLKRLYPTDYEAILWINKNIKAQPIILEAQGDSYTDYARVSSNTGLPTVLGWTVHEWLWRGSYDIPAPRITDVQKMYESEDLEETKNLLKKHNVEYVFLGDLERQKYPNLNEEKFKTLGKVVYESGKTKIYEISL